ncbi:redoxin domain-containing protein [Numidum massiliense]|uniref:redoxin domain-containing protein n=1 Tax=Numidum massiliense TaxID=1522315 RepID=UPI0006D58D98|nr:redoxin domain-containing protein [Numidum massiliense]
MSVTVGQQAPDFTLKATGDKETISLADYRGKNVVVLFYPFAFSPVCTDELCGLSDGLSDYSQLGVDIVAISVDSPFANAAFAAEQNIQLPLLSDFNKEVSAAYGVLYNLGDFQGVSKRSAFVVDKNGDVQYAWSSDDPKQLPDFAAIKRTLEQLNG